MNKDIASGNFKQLKGKIKQQWGKLTDDEIDQMEGNAEILAGKLQERYGYAKERAEKELDDFLKDLRERLIKILVKGDSIILE